MKKDLFKSDKIVIFDGAMGTMIQASGLKGGELPEKYNITHPEIIEGIHKSYIEAGADVITANTFGANSLKLSSFGLTPDAVINAGIERARKAAKDTVRKNTKVALDVGPLGQLMAPMGTLTFDDAYDLFAEQMIAGSKAGADLILIETISDLYEAKAAILAAKENTDLPIICTLTFEKNGRTLMGNDPLTVVTVLEGLGVDALGLNCSLGPDDLLPIVEKFTRYSHVPILVQANAGLPELINGQVVYKLEPEAFAGAALKMAEMGVRMIGSCCGTTPIFTQTLSNKLNSFKPVMNSNPSHTTAASSRHTIVFDEGFKVIGQRINTSNRADLINSLAKGDMDLIYEEAIMQKQNGADILDINLFTNDRDEALNMIMAVEYIQSMLPIPLQLDSADYKVLEAGARIYNGKPVLNSVNGSADSMANIFPIARKYGCCVVALTLDEKGIPSKAEDRLEIAKRIIQEAAKYNISKENIIIDCLVLSEAYSPDSMEETLKALRLIKNELCVKTMLGISNVSYGMRERSTLDAKFLASAMEAGLDAAILDPCSPDIQAMLAKA